MGILFIPALRGFFGDWVYYSCLMPGWLVAERINFAKELHQNKRLSDMIQRELKRGRSIEIANYLLSEQEKFFNSLVAAVYGGKPSWYEFDVKSQTKDISVDDIPKFALHSFGFLGFTGSEKLFALDGQHRLAGIKKVVDGGTDFEDEVSVILVAHSNTSRGLRRTRKLFTTLNKTAVPVSKGERIALDENDVMAIAVRRLVEDDPDFGGARIAYKATTNLSNNDVQSLTTIGNLYDVLGILFSKILAIGKLKSLQFSRPADAELDSIYGRTREFFALLRKYFAELDEYFAAEDYSEVVMKYRGTFGGKLLFRPVGLSIVIEAIGILSKTHLLEECVVLVSRLPRDLNRPPFADVLWDTKRRVMVNRARVLARTLMLYMLGEVKGTDGLHKDYAAAMGKEMAEVRLPRVVR